MNDAFEIQQLINTYHQAGSTADYERMIATYAPDAVWEFVSTGNRFVGLDAIREAVAGVTGTLQYVAQINAPATITVDGDRATARSSIRESARRVGANEGIEAFGTYDDTLVRTPDGWRFASRAFTTHWMHLVQIVPG
jgi:uncharacterized protein (TIGR02246 family)